MKGSHEDDGTHTPFDDSLIDRLVDGELPETERRALLARLDAEPGGWRRAALAFLEAQTLVESLAPIAAVSARPATLASAGPPRAGTRLRTWSARAAVLALAFALGWGSRGVGPGAPTPVAPTSRPLALPPETRANPPAVPDAPRMDPGTTPDALVKAWERRGYRIERRRRLVSMDLQGGRRMEVPVNEVRLEFVGDRTY